jgi:hypothetical protein
MLSPESAARNLLAVERGWSCALTGVRVAPPLLTVSPRKRPSILHKRLTRLFQHTPAPPTCQWWPGSHVARRRLMTPFVGTLLLLLLSPVSSRTFRASKRNSPPGALAHTHRITILELDVPLLEHINTGKTTSTEEGREGYTLPCPTQLYLHSPLLRASASNFFRLNCGTLLRR